MGPVQERASGALRKTTSALQTGWFRTGRGEVCAGKMRCCLALAFFVFFIPFTCG